MASRRLPNVVANVQHRPATALRFIGLHLLNSAENNLPKSTDKLGSPLLQLICRCDSMETNGYCHHSTERLTPRVDIMKSKYSHRAIFTFLIATIALATFPSSASAAVVLFETSYEAPEYNLGALSGQNGWIDYEFASFGNQVVNSGPARSGSQSLRLGKLAGQGPYGTTQRSGPFSTSLPQVIVEHSIYLEGTTGWNLGPGDYTQGSPIAVYGPGDVFISQFSVFQGLNVQFASVDVPITTDTWLDLKLVLDFPTQTASGYLNGTFIGTEAFANPASEIALLEVYGLMGFTTPGPSPSFYFDDLRVTAVPEPGSAFLLAGTVFALGFRRLRRVGQQP
jgi:hypothetical protein